MANARFDENWAHTSEVVAAVINATRFKGPAVMPNEINPRLRKKVDTVEEVPMSVFQTVLCGPKKGQS